VFVDRAHVGELQTPAKLNAKEPETHVPDLPEAQSWFLHRIFLLTGLQDYLLLKIAAERCGKVTRILPSRTTTSLLAPRRSVKEAPFRSDTGETSNSISALLLSLLIATTTVALLVVRAYTYCCSAT